MYQICCDSVIHLHEIKSIQYKSQVFFFCLVFGGKHINFAQPAFSNVLHTVVLLREEIKHVNGEELRLWTTSASRWFTHTGICSFSYFLIWAQWG